jgi:hypothetical protein
METENTNNAQQTNNNVIEEIVEVVKGLLFPEDEAERLAEFERRVVPFQYRPARQHPSTASVRTSRRFIPPPCSSPIHSDCNLGTCNFPAVACRGLAHLPHRH